MQCSRVEQRIHELLDERLDPLFDLEVVGHAAYCSECQHLLDAQGKLLEGLHRLPVPELSHDFSRRVVASVGTLPNRRFSRVAPAVAFLAIVATLFLVVALGPQKRRSIGPADDARVVASALVDHDSAMTSREALMGGIDSQDVRVVIEHLVAQIASGDGARFYQVDQLAGTIRPLASTLNVAFDAIRRSIPSRRQPLDGKPQAIHLPNASAIGVI